MANRLIQCPACNASVIARGSAATMSCPYCGTAVAVPEDLRQASGVTAWSTLLFDSFSANENNWLVGSQTSEYFTKLNQAIADGRYRWEALVSRPSSMTTAWLMGYPVSDFQLSVSCKHIRGNRVDSAWGLLFRIQDNQNCYWFRMTDNQFFAVSVIKEAQWLNLVEWTRTDAIKSGGVNQLEVIAAETHFTFLLNGQVVSEVTDDHFRQGLVGLAIEGYPVGEETTFDFLDFSLRAP